MVFKKCTHPFTYNIQIIHRLSAMTRKPALKSLQLIVYDSLACPQTAISPLSPGLNAWATREVWRRSSFSAQEGRAGDGGALQTIKGALTLNPPAHNTVYSQTKR